MNIKELRPGKKIKMKHKVRNNMYQAARTKTVTYTIVKRYRHHVHCTYQAGGNVINTSFRYWDLRKGVVDE